MLHVHVNLYLTDIVFHCVSQYQNGGNQPTLVRSGLNHLKTVHIFILYTVVAHYCVFMIWQSYFPR